jgi:DNA-directed RNA polymerase subunit RPC12/RpoP
LRVKVYYCSDCGNILRKLQYRIADKKLDSGYTKPKTITTDFYLCVKCEKTFSLGKLKVLNKEDKWVS